MKLSELNILDIGNVITISGAIYSGNGKHYLCFFPSEDDGEVIFSEAIETLDMNVEDWQVFLRQSDTMETETLVKAVDGTITKAILRKSQRQIDASISWKVFKRDQYKCRYCGRDDAPLTVDHIICWEEGGPTTEDNLLTADKACNRARGSISYSSWLEHPYYKRVSASLTEDQRIANRKLIETLISIPRVHHIRSR